MLPPPRRKAATADPMQVESAQRLFLLARETAQVFQGSVSVDYHGAAGVILKMSRDRLGPCVGATLLVGILHDAGFPSARSMVEGDRLKTVVIVDMPRSAVIAAATRMLFDTGNNYLFEVPNTLEF